MLLGWQLRQLLADVHEGVHKGELRGEPGCATVALRLPAHQVVEHSLRALVAHAPVVEGTPRCQVPCRQLRVAGAGAALQWSVGHTVRVDAYKN